MSSFRRVILVAATSCAATLAFVSTVHISCGAVPPACADQCADLAMLQEKVAALEASVSAALKPVAFRAFLGATQSVSSGMDATVALDQVELDTHGAFEIATYQYVIPVSGQYAISTTLSYSGRDSATAYTGMDKARANVEIWVIRRDKTELGLAVGTTPGNSSGTGATLLRVHSAKVVNLELGDRVFVRTFHDYGVPRNLTAGLRETNLQIIRIPGLD